MKLKEKEELSRLIKENNIIINKDNIINLKNESLKKFLQIIEKVNKKRQCIERYKYLASLVKKKRQINDIQIILLLI